MQAHALAEKNMRDRLVQKEQEERNVIFLSSFCDSHVSHFALQNLLFFWQRVAEVLDADVKRWSSGKTGNLRALLSTLQYVCVNILTLFKLCAYFVTVMP